MSRYEPVLSQTIVASVDSVLATSTPAFLESIRMTTFTRELCIAR
jgi:Ca2+-dependent lipid-binding protein